MARTTFLQAQQKLATYLGYAMARGIKLEPEHFANSDNSYEKTVCLCGSVLVATGTPFNDIEYEMTGEEIIQLVAKRLGITVAQAASLNNGFEGVPFRGDKPSQWDPSTVRGAQLIVKKFDHKWYTIGKAFRRQWEKANAEQ